MFHTIESFDTSFSADSVEWCPSENYEDIFVCGTYQLTNDESIGSSKGEVKKRVGRIYLFKVVKNEKLQLKLLQQVDVPAVLDMKWAHVKSEHDKTLLGVVNSEGFLQIYELVEEAEKVCLKFLSEISVNESSSSTLALSLDWSTGSRASGELKISASDSEGSVTLFKISSDGTNIERIRSWSAHNFEAWITAFDYWDTNIIYSGGDDCKFLRFDARVESDSPVTKNSSHNAGVTSLHSNWKKEFCLVSGSYDEVLRTWDTRKLKRPVGELNLGGGIWRLKWDPYEAKRLLAACMYNGFFIVDCENPESPEMIAEYKEHESIAYGCDWSFVNGKFGPRGDLLDDEGDILVGTCSFYDHILKLSTVKFDELKS